MNTEVTLTSMEQKRLKVLNQVQVGRITGEQAAFLLGVSLRQERRLMATYRRRGAAGLAHGNRGRPCARRVPQKIRDKLLALAREEFRDFNDQHFTEILGEEYAIRLSRSTVRRLRREAGLASPRKRRASRRHQKRERYPQAGMLLQVDGSHHDWLEGRGPLLVLLAAIDDATSQLVYARFREQEDAAGYFLMLYEICRTHGLPLALYADRHTIFQSPKEPSVAEQLTGKLPRSQFGRLVDDLGIRLIPAHSPQAKGRVERLFGTLQDRLVKALRRAKVSTLEEANQLLETFLPAFNTRFGQPPAYPGSAYLPWPARTRPEDLFCFKFERVVAKDNTVSFAGHDLVIPLRPLQRGYAGARVGLRHYMDGRLAIAYHGRTLVVYDPLQPGTPQVGKFTPAEAVGTAVKKISSKPIAQPKPQGPRTPLPIFVPGPDHPWRRPYKSMPIPRGPLR
jgi:transposase